MVPSINILERCIRKFEKSLFGFNARADKCECLWNGSGFVKVSHTPTLTYAIFDITGKRIRVVEGVNVRVQDYKEE